MVLIVIDGLDASGKTTQARKLCHLLKTRKKTVFLRFHPSNDNFFGAKTKHFLYLQGVNAHFSAALFYMLDVIRSILLYSWRRYDYLIFVRYLMGTAYLPSPFHRIAYHFFARIVPTSNQMFFLDVQPKEAYRRIRQTRHRQERFENIEDLRRVRSKALALALEGRWLIINANNSKRAVGKKIETLCS